MTVGDLYSMAEDEQIGIYAFDLGEITAMSIEHEDWSCDIALDLSDIDTYAEEKAYLAHEMGHCMTGSFYNRYSPFDVRQRHENKADRWAIKSVCPYAEMLEAMRDGYTTPWELADRFSVTEAFIEKAYAYYTGACGLSFNA